MDEDFKKLLDEAKKYAKKRVLSDVGHLSNRTTAEYLKQIVGINTKYILLAHISEKNNTIDLAYSTTHKLLKNTNINMLS